RHDVCTLVHGERRAFLQGQGPSMPSNTVTHASGHESAAALPKPVHPLTGETDAKTHPLKRFIKTLGPGLVTGASDDDPSGIGTYALAGASFGYATLWTAL